MARPKNAQNFKLVRFSNGSGSVSWRISGTGADGNRIRRNFRDKSEALQTIADLELDLQGKPETSRAARTSLNPEELLEAEAATRQADGLRLSHVVAHYLALKERATKAGVDLDEAMGFVESRYRPETKATSIFNAKEEFLGSRIGLSATTIRNYEHGLGLLLQGDPNKAVHSFTIDDIEKILANYSNLNTRKTYRRTFSVFFNWAVRHHYCLEDPCSRLDKLPSELSQIGILSLDEVQRLLQAATRYQDGVAVAPIAIALFAGLRPSEIADLKPTDISSEKIRVSGGKLRRRLKRSVPVPANLKAWLQKYPFKGLPDGWAYKMKVLKAATEADHWVHDVLRHTSITYQVERDRNEALTAFNCGTSIQMMDRHYRNVIDDSKALACFWGLTPSRIGTVEPEIALPSNKQVSWPEKAALKKLVWQKPMIHVAADIGVSDVALKKRCVKLGIALPPRGHWLR